MIDGTEKPKNPSKSAKRTARYNEFLAKWIYFLSFQIWIQILH